VVRRGKVLRASDAESIAVATLSGVAARPARSIRASTRLSGWSTTV
jgi:hypothetical protein